MFQCLRQVLIVVGGVFFCSVVYSQTEKALLAFKIIDFESQKAAIAQLVTQPIILEELIFQSDVECSHDELQALSGLHPGTTIGATDLVQAVWYIIKKQKFETIKLIVKPSNKGIVLTIILESFWTLAQVKIKGVAVGRDSFRQYYLLEQGERFDLERHTDSVDHLKEALFAQGYCNATIESTLKKDEGTKSVAVTLKVSLHERFKIDHVHVTWEGTDSIATEHIGLLRREIEELFCARLTSHRYSKVLLNRETQWLKDCLAYRGFFHVDINLVEHIDYDAHALDMHFNVIICPPRQFVFFGNNFFSSSRLLDQLEVFGGSLSQLPPSVLIQELITLYHKKGFFDAQITTESATDQSLFFIEEGHRIRIEEIQLQGVSFFNPSVLVKNHCAAIFKKTAFDKDNLEKALQAIIIAYQEAGFWDARVVTYRCVARAEGEHCLVVEIDEGKQCFIQKVTIDPPLQYCINKSPFKSKQKMACSVERLAKQRAALEREIAQFFLIIQTIKPTLTRNGNDISVHWHINTASREERFGKSVLVGCPSFPYHYIMRELAFNEGDLFNTDRIKQSVVRLKDLDIFETIQITPGVVLEDGQRPMFIKVHKDDPYELRLRAGFGLQQMSTQFTFRSFTWVGGALFKIKNPFNRADQLRFEIDYKQGMRSAIVSYRQPWIMDYPIAVNVDGYTIKYFQPGWIETQHNLYTILQQGFLVGLTHKRSWISLGINAGFEWMETKTTSVPDNRFFNLSLARALNFVPALLNHHVPYIMAEPTMLVDFTDSKVNPTKGSFTLVTLKTMIPLAYRDVTSYFVKLFVQQSVYIPCPPFQLLFGLRAGYIFQKNLSSIMPSERFYLGGANSIRSYQTDSCPPLGLFCNTEGEKVFVPQGARAMLRMNAELHFPLFSHVEGAVFQDIGALSNTVFTQIRAKDLLPGTGFGLRYVTPIGPLRFDIAWKWHREDPSISRFAWYVTFGSVF